MKKKEFWDKKNPNKTSKKLTPEQIKSAKARAKAAGRKYPNLVDNAAVARKKK
jgi:hypothetical protein